MRGSEISYLTGSLAEPVHTWRLGSGRSLHSAGNHQWPVPGQPVGCNQLAASAGCSHSCLQQAGLHMLPEVAANGKTIHQTRLIKHRLQACNMVKFKSSQKNPAVFSKLSTAYL